MKTTKKPIASLSALKNLGNSLSGVTATQVVEPRSIEAMDIATSESVPEDVPKKEELITTPVPPVTSTSLWPQRKKKKHIGGGRGKSHNLYLHPKDEHDISVLYAFLAGKALRPSVSLVLKAAVRLAAKHPDNLYYEAYKEVIKQDMRYTNERVV